MSPPLKSFEGPDVEVLLARIRREAGPDAKINGAEKIRVGGVLGFFAKEHYRVLVEAADVRGVLRPVEAGRNRQPAHARAGRRDRRKGEGRAVAPAPGSVVLRDAEPTAPVPAVVRDDTDLFAALADATDDVNAVYDVDDVTVTAGASTAPVAVGSDSFDAVLCRISATLDSPSPALTAASSAGGGGPATMEGTADRGVGTGTIEGTSAGGAGTSAGDGQGGRDHDGPGHGSGYDRHGYPTPDPGTVYAADLVPRSLASEAAQFLAGTAGGGAHGAVLDALRRAGVDEEAVRAAAEALGRGAGAEALLLEAFSRLSAAPALPRRPGSLLVVVGAGPRAQALAEVLSTEVGSDPAEVPYASIDAAAAAAGHDRLLVGTAEDAAELAPGWRRGRVAVVAVDAALSGNHRSWAAHVIAALRPTAVWGVVDATCKAEDVRAWGEDLGGIDAVALENVDATVSPTAALGSGIPVVRLDGRPASAARWTATVVDRIDRCT
jgi:hypothetical protein